MKEIKELTDTDDSQKEIQVIDVPINTISKPLISPEEALKEWENYQRLVNQILKPEDTQEIQGRPFKKKSFWRKLDKFFGLSLILVSEKKEFKNILIRKYTEERESKSGNKYPKDITEIEYYPEDYSHELKEGEQLKKTLIFNIVYRAIAPNGQYMDGDGACDTWEKGYPDGYHDTRATAHTRAKNRAISDLVGFGEVSAEEVTRSKDYNNRSYPSSRGKSQSNNQKSSDYINMENIIKNTLDNKDFEGEIVFNEKKINLENEKKSILKRFDSGTVFKMDYMGKIKDDVGRMLLAAQGNKEKQDSDFDEGLDTEQIEI